MFPRTTWEPDGREKAWPQKAVPRTTGVDIKKLGKVMRSGLL
jgi:hypothetical protein